jgi:2-polyprenyl-3-methyl-5-hydroxy-6-metoxy-1,4-benzoquinol methylase
MLYNVEQMPVTPEDVEQFDLTYFLDISNRLTAERAESQFRENLKLLNKFRPVDSGFRILEIGPGIGWFQVNCLRNGVDCEGLELSPQCVERARELGERYGVQPKVRLGNIENTDIGESQYDAIVAESVLEHLPNWKEAVQKIYAALKPEGVFYFSSSNKFAFVSGEFRRIPLYGWFPDKVRRWIRTTVEGPGVLLWYMDCNQFRYPFLRKFLGQVGFRDIFDYIEMKDPDDLNNPTRTRRFAAKILKSSKLAKRLCLTFWPTTVFLCRK